jgi:flagellar assembly protein FliH
MSTIIRASDRNASIHGVAYNLTDMAGEADRYLDRLRAEGAKIVAKAQQDAEAIRRQAQEEGRNLAVEIVRKQFAQQLETLLPALKQVVEDIRQAKQAWLTQWEKSAVHVAAAIAERIIRRELSNTPEITLTLVREALELAAGSSELRIHLNPGDHETLGARVEVILGELSGLAPAELVADPEITPGGCRVETRFGTIDQQFEAQLARIEEELT